MEKVMATREELQRLYQHSESKRLADQEANLKDVVSFLRDIAENHATKGRTKLTFRFFDMPHRDELKPKEIEAACKEAFYGCKVFACFEDLIIDWS